MAKLTDVGAVMNRSALYIDSLVARKMKDWILSQANGFLST